MSAKEALEKLRRAEMLVTPEALETITNSEEPELLADRVLGEKNIFIVDAALLKKIAETDRDRKIPMPVEVSRAPDFKPEAAEYDSELKILEDSDISGRSRCTGTVDDFVDYFKDRYTRLSDIFRKFHMNQNGITPLSSLKNFADGRDVRVVGIVSGKRDTAKGHMMIELESTEGNAKVLFLKSDRDPGKTIFEKARSLVLDEVIAVDGRYSQPFVIAKEVHWPEVPIREVKRVEKDVGIAFMSDMHVGSRHFMERNFTHMLGWLCGKGNGEKERELAGKVKYLLIAGDTIDGIGVFPRQERELEIKDVYAQYKKMFQLLEKVPEHIEIVVSPGNHDAVRRAEPQPRIPKELVGDIGAKNIHIVGNPCYLKIEGLKTVMYHGSSLDSIIASVPGMNYQHPEKPMMELLKRRLLSPIYGGAPIAPEKKDYMVIEDAPDLVHMGHIHKNAYAIHKGTVLVNSGTWQSQTEYQVQKGHVPTPCILPVYELKRTKITEVSFA